MASTQPRSVWASGSSHLFHTVSICNLNASGKRLGIWECQCSYTVRLTTSAIRTMDGHLACLPGGWQMEDKEDRELWEPWCPRIQKFAARASQALPPSLECTASPKQDCHLWAATSNVNTLVELKRCLWARDRRLEAEVSMINPKLYCKEEIHPLLEAVDQEFTSFKAAKILMTDIRNVCCILSRSK